MKRPDNRRRWENARKEDRAEDYRIVYRGRLAQNAIKSDFFDKFMLPYLEHERLRLEKECRFNPSRGDSPSLEKLAILNTFNSGAIHFIENLLSEINSWVTMGEESALKIKKEKEANHEK